MKRGVIPKKESHNCVDYGANRKLIYKSNQANNNINNYNSKTHRLKVLRIVEIHQSLQNTLKYLTGGKQDPNWSSPRKEKSSKPPTGENRVPSKRNS